MFGRHGVVLDAVPTSSEILSPQQYLKLDRAQREKIQEVKIAPARLGEKSFGGLLVRYKYPTYKVSP